MRWLIKIANWRSGAWLFALGLLILIPPALEGFTGPADWPASWLGWVFTILGVALIGAGLLITLRRRR